MISAAVLLAAQGSGPLFWTLALACLAAWLLLGLAARARVGLIMSRVSLLPRAGRVFLGTGGLALGMAVLAAGMYGVAAAGGAEGGIKPWAWGAILVLGGLFISMQVLGACALASLLFARPADGKGTETGKRPGASGTPEGRS